MQINQKFYTTENISKEQDISKDNKEILVYKISPEQKKSINKSLAKYFVTWQTFPVLICWISYYALTWREFMNYAIPIESFTIGITTWRMMKLASHSVDWVKANQSNSKPNSYQLEYKLHGKSPKKTENYSFVQQQRDRINIKIENKYFTLFRNAIVGEDKTIEKVLKIEEELVSQTPLDKATLFKILSKYNAAKAQELKEKKTEK